MALCSVPVFAGVAPDASASKAQTTVLQQNNKVVKGHIVDESGEPLIGVSVKELGTNNGAVPTSTVTSLSTEQARTWKSHTSASRSRWCARRAA